jgi:hypothetical protein
MTELSHTTAADTPLMIEPRLADPEMKLTRSRRLP